MSASPSVDTFASHLSVSSCLNITAFVILYYDYTLTFADEVDRFWTRSITLPSFLFYLNRYLSILGHVIVILQYFWDARRDALICPSLSSFHQYFAVVIQTLVGFLLIVRTYALYGRSRWALLFMLSVAAAVIAFGTWTVVSGPSGSQPNGKWTGIGCVPPMTQARALRFAAAWAGMLVFDIMIFLMTIYKSMQRSRAGHRTLTHILLRDGAVYFGIMAAITLCNVLSFIFSVNSDRGFMTTFANVISSTMISRLMLNLRDPSLALRSPGATADGSTQTYGSTTKPVFSTLVFKTVYSSRVETGFTNETMLSTAGADGEIEMTKRRV